MVRPVHGRLSRALTLWLTVPSHLFVPITGCSVPGSGCRVPRRPPSKHRPGARGGCSAAVEAAGAGAAKDGFRSAQDAQLEQQRGQVKDPGRGCQFPELEGAGATFPFASTPVFPGSSLKKLTALSLVSLCLEMLYLAILIRDCDGVSDLLCLLGSLG